MTPMNNAEGVCICTRVRNAVAKTAICWVLAALAMILGAAKASQAAITEPVRIEAGLVSGAVGRDESITVYKGIPYAAAPIGDLRWRAPQPALPWRGVRKTDQFGSVCLQRQRNVWVGSEDCLFVNVWTGAASGNERRPVLVWSYGGGFVGNSGSNPQFDGEGLARKGIVVVTMNYRPGVMGFLATPELSRESGHNASGNYGMLDQIAVLQWVQNNIAAFGGDPSRVTIAGQSAGGLSTLMLLRSPLAAGMYHRAIMQSRARSIRKNLNNAEISGAKYAETHGARSLQELRAMPWRQLVEGSDGNDPDDGGPLFRPVVDGWVIPLDFYRVFVDGWSHHVPVIVGQNLDENGATPQPSIELGEYKALVKQQFGALADEFLKLYPAGTDREAGQMHNAAGRDDSRVATFLMATLGKYAARNKSYAYFWTHAPPRDPRGAYHGSEINYVFNNLYVIDRPWTAADRKIADTMSSYWANFIATGDPNGKGLPAWPAADAKVPMVMALGDQIGLIPVAEKPRLDFVRQYYMSHGTFSGWH